MDEGQTQSAKQAFLVNRLRARVQFTFQPTWAFGVPGGDSGPQKKGVGPSSKEADDCCFMWWQHGDLTVIFHLTNHVPTSLPLTLSLAYKCHSLEHRCRVQLPLRMKTFCNIYGYWALEMWLVQLRSKTFYFNWFKFKSKSSLVAIGYRIC